MTGWGKAQNRCFSSRLGKQLSKYIPLLTPLSATIYSLQIAIIECVEHFLRPSYRDSYGYYLTYTSYTV